MKSVLRLITKGILIAVFKWAVLNRWAQPRYFCVHFRQILKRKKSILQVIEAFQTTNFVQLLIFLTFSLLITNIVLSSWRIIIFSFLSSNVMFCTGKLLESHCFGSWSWSVLENLVYFLLASEYSINCKETWISLEGRNQ